MFSQETLQRVDAITELQQAALTECITDAEAVRRNLVGAQAAVTTAEEAVKNAKQALGDAQQTVRTLESNEQHAERETEKAARQVAIAISQDPQLEPVAKTLLALIYEDRKLAWQNGPDNYGQAVERGKTALSSIVERLKPGAPLLYFHGEKGITAHRATEGSLVATVPQAKRHDKSNYVSLEGGSLAVVMPDSPTAQVTEQGLVKVEQQTVAATLLSHMYGYDLEHLETAAANNKWLVIGEKAIAAQVLRFEPMERFAALTALRAVGVEPDVKPAPDVKAGVEKKLISLLAFLASGTGQETTTRTVESSDAWLGFGSHTSHITEDTPLTTMAKTIDKFSIRTMAQTLGEDRHSLKAKVEATLKNRANNASTSLDQLSKDVQSMLALDQILDTIFG